MRLTRVAFGVIVAMLAVLAMSSSALAQDVESVKPPKPVYDAKTDPLTTNIPYVAWMGQSIKVMKCIGWDPHGDLVDENGEVSQATADSLGLKIDLRFSVPGSFLIEGWSGEDSNSWGPNFQTGNDPKLATVPMQVTRRGLCWAANVTSLKPGLAIIKLSIEHQLLLDIALVLRGEGLSLSIGMEDIALFKDIVDEHQFLAIWMEQDGVHAVEMDSKGPGLSYHVGDPDGDGKFQPPYKCEKGIRASDVEDDYRIDEHYDNLWCVFGLVKIHVKGKFPMGQNFSGMFPNNVVRLPAQWPDLAAKLAVDKWNGEPGSAKARWDIHDDNVKGDGLFGYHENYFRGGVLPDHHVNSVCKYGGSTPKNLLTDAVDNCLGGGDIGIFSSIHGGTFWTVGPFDPVRPWQTLLSDGKLNADDTPMPSTPVEISLGGNDIGALGRVDKSDIYTVLGPHAKAGYSQPHNLYAPFYKAYVPAATAGSDRSGVYQASTNNFPGYIEDGKYEYWNTYNKVYRRGDNACYDVLGHPFAKPTGASKVEVYTDEHGEAWVKFYPYRGLFLTPDNNGLCDVYKGGKQLYGNATITVKPKYPGQPIYTSTWPSASVSKTAYHLANKTLVCIPKATNVAFCVETVTDLNGDPLEGVKVKFTTSGDSANMIAASLKLGAYDTRGQEVVTSGGEENYVVVRTNKLGQGGVEIVHSQNACIDVTAENYYTRNGGFGILRFFEFNPHTGLPCGGNAGGGGSSGGGSGGGSTGGGSTGGGSTSGGGGGGATATGSESVVVSLGGPVTPVQQPVLSAPAAKTTVVTAATAQLFSVKVLQSKLGRYLVVNVKSAKLKTAKVRIAILGKNGKVIKTIVRSVPTNKAVRISNLTLPKAAVSVKTSVTA